MKLAHFRKYISNRVVVFLPIYQRLSIYSSNHLPVYLSTFLRIYLSLTILHLAYFRRFICNSPLIFLPIYLYTYFIIYLFLPIVQLSFFRCFISIYLSIYPYLYCNWLFLDVLYLTVLLFSPIYLSTFLSIYLSSPILQLANLRRCRFSSLCRLNTSLGSICRLFPVRSNTCRT